MDSGVASHLRLRNNPAYIKEKQPLSFVASTLHRLKFRLLRVRHFFRRQWHKIYFRFYQRILIAYFFSYFSTPANTRGKTAINAILGTERGNSVPDCDPPPWIILVMPLQRLPQTWWIKFVICHPLSPLKPKWSYEDNVKIANGFTWACNCIRAPHSPPHGFKTLDISEVSLRYHNTVS